ncbi:MAG: tRNA (N(6)-L-threonylcarbamoyladenosine(37)-C(2))-methylthiotransferase MtaB [bacterium]
MKIAFKTIGCKLNQAETEILKYQFKKENFTLVKWKEEANIYIINTCCVTNRSSYKCRQAISEIQKRQNNSKIIVTGCYAQVYPEEIKNVDFVIGNFEKNNLLNYIKNIFPKQTTSFFPIDDFTDRTRAFVKIQDGCNNKCSYCVVPLARGKSRSENPNEILEQIKNIIANGYQEIVLTGANLGSYYYENTTLAKLLKQIIEIPKLGRIRLSSIELTEFDDDLIEIINSSKICNHLHIPLQNGSEKILKKMNRNYKLNTYENLIERLNKSKQDLSIGTDIIIGFPEETEKDFLETYNFLKKLPFSYFHIFPYSPRPKTTAYNFENNISSIDIKNRCKKIKILDLEKRKNFEKNFLNKELEIIVENTRDKKTNLLKGLSSNYLKILVDGPNTLNRKLIKIKVTEIKDEILYGIL